MDSPGKDMTQLKVIINIKLFHLGVGTPQKISNDSYVFWMVFLQIADIVQGFTQIFNHAVILGKST